MTQLKKGNISYSWAMSHHNLIHINDYKNEEIWCPTCDGKMLARKGNKIRNHFAHFPNNKCGGPERVEHLLAKDILLKNNSLFLPIAKKNLNGKDYTKPSYIIKYKNPISEKWIDGFIPDIIISTDIYEMFIVEIMITHKSDYSKRKWIVQNNIPAIEIDCRNIMDLNPDIINDYVLYRAPRKWLYSPELAKEIISDFDKLNKKSINKEDNSKRMQELIIQSNNVIKLFNQISTNINDPDFTQIEKNNIIYINNTESPFLFSNTYIGTLLKTYQNVDLVLRILKSKNGLKYQLNNELYMLLIKYKKKDFSCIFYLKMILSKIKKRYGK